MWMHIPSPATLPSLSALRTVHVHERVSQRIVYTPDIYISESKKKRESTWAICSLNHDRLRSAIACTALSAQLRTHFIILVHWITSCASDEKNYPQSVYAVNAGRKNVFMLQNSIQLPRIWILQLGINFFLNDSIQSRFTLKRVQLISSFSKTSLVFLITGE